MYFMHIKILKICRKYWYFTKVHYGVLILVFKYFRNKRIVLVLKYKYIVTVLGIYLSPFQSTSPQPCLLFLFCLHLLSILFLKTPKIRGIQRYSLLFSADATTYIPLPLATHSMNLGTATRTSHSSHDYTCSFLLTIPTAALIRFHYTQPQVAHHVLGSLFLCAH